jgi:hypothetical protein
MRLAVVLLIASFCVSAAPVTPKQSYPKKPQIEELFAALARDFAMPMPSAYLAISAGHPYTRQACCSLFPVQCFDGDRLLARPGIRA